MYVVGTSWWGRLWLTPCPCLLSTFLPQVLQSILGRGVEQGTPWSCLCPKPTFPVGRNHSIPPTVLCRTAEGLPVTPSASWSQSWDSPQAGPPILGCCRPSSHPALPASARMATDSGLTHADMRTCVHTQPQTLESDFWPISSPEDSSGPVSLVSLCLESLSPGGAGCCLSAGFV